MSEAAETRIDLRWDIADRLRKALRTADVSVGDMAGYLGVSRQTVGRYINGHVTPDRRTLRLWALRCKVPLRWLAEGDEQAPAGGFEPYQPADLLFPALRDRHLTASEKQERQETFRGLIRRGTFNPSAVRVSAVLPIASSQ